MSVVIKGQDDLRRKLLDRLPRQIAKVLEGAARAGGRVIAEEARQGCTIDAVRSSIKVKVVAATDAAHVGAKVQTSGRGAYLAPWLEYGIKPHIIAVRDDADRKGLSVNAINRAAKQGTLVIGGEAVGPIVYHPGVPAHPFLRPAVDRAEPDAFAAAQRYITSRVSGSAKTKREDGV